MIGRRSLKKIGQKSNLFLFLSSNCFPIYRPFQVEEKWHINRYYISFISSLYSVFPEVVLVRINFILSLGSRKTPYIKTSIISTKLASPVPCGTSIRTGTRDRASTWKNKLCARIILRAHSRTFFRRQRYHTLPPRLHIARAQPLSTHWRQSTGT